MNKKMIRGFRTNLVLYGICLCGFVMVTIPVSGMLALAEAIVTIIVIAVGIRRNRLTQRGIRQYLDRINGGADSARSSNMLYTPLAMLVFDMNSEEVLWCNELFNALTDKKNHIYECTLHDVIREFDTHWLLEGKTECPDYVRWNDRIYRVFGGLSNRNGIGADENLLATTYWMDITEVEQMHQSLEMTHPVVSILMLDNYEEVMKACPESKRSALIAAIENKLNEWSAPSGGLLLGYDRDRYLFLIEEKDFTTFAEKKFEVLDSVRSVETNGVAVTLSIGVGRDADDFDTLFKFANMALEMALSRGGDQAVVKDRLNFEFYGGKTKATEKRTKVKSRVMANALSELINDSKQVYIMGHRYADMDALGAAVGVYCISRKMGKKACIVMDVENNAARPVLNQLLELPEYQGAFISADTAFLKANAGTLLVVVDTNRPDSVESEPLLESCNRVAVIDHHRRGSSYIDKMALNYHEPYASSASELVTELLQYMIEPSDLLRQEAEALMAGIVLDTKNFTNHTGSRTFEAGAYLRKVGADTQSVQRLFQSDLDSMIARYSIIQKAEIHRGNIAIVISDEEYDRVVAAKAADELLNLQGVSASFVLYQKGDGVSMSARSLGEINVQVILEALGGGGNSTTAGGQKQGIGIAEAKKILIKAIDKYLDVI